MSFKQESHFLEDLVMYVDLSFASGLPVPGVASGGGIIDKRCVVPGEEQREPSPRRLLLPLNVSR